MEDNNFKLDGKTEQEWREASYKSMEAKEESFDRCDTDGFLSQWAHGLSSVLSQTKAEIAANGGMAEFPALFHKESGKRVRAKLIWVKNKFAPWEGEVGRWMFVDLNGKATGTYLPFGKASRKQKQLGYFQGTETAPANAKYEGTGRGLSGRCWVATYRTDKGYPETAEVF